MTPRSMTLAFRIWAYATPKGWDCSPQEIGEALGETTRRIFMICRHRGWMMRLRTETHVRGGTPLAVDCGQGYAPEPDLNLSMWIE